MREQLVLRPRRGLGCPGLRCRLLGAGQHLRLSGGAPGAKNGEHGGGVMQAICIE